MRRLSGTGFPKREGALNIPYAAMTSMMNFTRAGIFIFPLGLLLSDIFRGRGHRNLHARDTLEIGYNRLYLDLVKPYGGAPHIRHGANRIVRSGNSEAGPHVPRGFHHRLVKVALDIDRPAPVSRVLNPPGAPSGDIA